MPSLEKYAIEGKDRRRRGPDRDLDVPRSPHLYLVPTAATGHVGGKTEKADHL